MTQSTQEQVGSIIGSITGGITGSEDGGGGQDASVDGLLNIGGNISQAYSGRGALPF